MRNRNLLESFNRAFEGIIYVFRTQRNMKLHFLAAFFILLISLWIPLTKVEVLVLFFAIALVLLAEMFNTAIEVGIDLVTKEYHPLAAIAKNVAAGAVLIAAINAVVVGYLIFFPRLDKELPVVVESLRKSQPYLVLATLILVVAVVVSAKAYFGKGRPLSGGMPSGHAALSFALATVILFKFQAPGGFAGLSDQFLGLSRYEAKIHNFWEIVAGGARRLWWRLPSSRFFALEVRL